MQWRVEEHGSEQRYYGVNPDEPYGDAHIVSVQPDLMQDYSSGLNSTKFWVHSVQTYGIAVHYKVSLFCDHAQTPWCDQLA